MRDIGIHAVVTGMVLGALLVAAMFATGQTFGQRCAKLYDTAKEQEACIHRLTKGEAP